MTPVGPRQLRAVRQATTGPEPGPETGPNELAVLWPFLVQLGWFLVGFLTVVVVGRVIVQPLLARGLRRRNRNNPTIQAAVILYFRLFVVLTGVLVGLAVAGYGQFLNDSALVVSAVALAIGIAAREVIGSLVSGLALVLDSEFNVGDHIQWEGGEGVVQSIALRVTRVETIDGELVTIPNTILTGHELVRPYGRGSRRVVQELEVDYEEDFAEVLDELTDVARDTDRVLADPPPAAFVHELGDDAVSIRVQYWIADPSRRDVFAVRSEYAQAVTQRLHADGVTVSPAAQRELTGQLRLADGPPDE